MRNGLLGFLLLSTALFVGPAAHAADFTVRVDARDVQSKRVHTELGIPVKPGALTLVYPQWIPGEHGPTGPLDSMIGLHIRANGADLPWTRDPLDLFALHVDVPARVVRLEIALESGLTTAGGGFTSAPTSSEQLAVLAWNQFLLLPEGSDADKLSIDATVIAPPGWTVVSALPSTVGADNSRVFATASIARLIDSPVQMGRYATLVRLPGSEPRADIEHSISIIADSNAALEIPEPFAAGYGRLVAEAGALFGTRMYRHYTWLLSLSDDIAHFGLEHHESSDDRREERALLEEDTRMGIAGLLSHEYVHSWNGKYRRPAGLLSADYQEPMDGSLLWVYEGLTEFWGDVLASRAGLVAPRFYRERLAALAAHFENEPGASWRPLADTAVAAQELYEVSSAWESGRRGTDFYEASVFLWFDVDAELRERSGGKATLDDFARQFYAGAAGAPALKPYNEPDVYAALARIAPTDWRRFIRRHLDATDTKALLGVLARIGWRLEYTAVKNDWTSLGEKRSKGVNREWSIGLRVDEDNVILDTNERGAAAKAGVGPGMTLIAVNGKKYTADVLDAALVAAQRAHEPIELLVENADYFKTFKVQYNDGPRYPHLVPIAGQPDLLGSVLAPRAK
ncbi:MAG TPA: M61 family peptidase [Gammaproteobacteria bacterium]|nr:M61 family peptidase [Gammaproteobacteria bacterium]